MKVKLYDLKGNTKEEVEVKSSFESKVSDENLLTRYVRVYLINQRQGTVKTKNKSEKSGGGKKPWKQKGTGRARVGSIRSPLWTGGGVIHGPNPREWSAKLPKKIRSRVFASVINQKLSSDTIAFFESLKEVKTKFAAQFIKSLDLDNKKVLVIHDNNENIFKSFRNMPKVSVKSINEINTFDVLLSDFILVENNTKDALLDKLKMETKS